MTSEKDIEPKIHLNQRGAKILSERVLILVGSIGNATIEKQRGLSLRTELSVRSGGVRLLKPQDRASEEHPEGFYLADLRGKYVNGKFLANVDGSQAFTFSVEDGLWIAHNALLDIPNSKPEINTEIFSRVGDGAIRAANLIIDQIVTESRK